MVTRLRSRAIAGLVAVFLLIVAHRGLTAAQAAAAPRVYVGNWGYASVDVIDVASNSVVDLVELGSWAFFVPDYTVFVEGVAVNHAGTRLYATSAYLTSALYVVDTASDRVVATVDAGADPVAVAVSPDDSRLYVSNGFTGTTVTVLDTTQSYRRVASVLVGQSPAGLAVTPDGKRLYVANSGFNTVSVVDTATNQVARTVMVGDGPEGVAISVDGARVYVTNSRHGTVSVIDTATDQVVATVQVGATPAGVAVSPDGARVYVANSGSNDVSVIDTTQNYGIISTIAVGKGPQGVGVTPDGTRVFVANELSNTVSVIDAASNVEAGRLNVQVQPKGVAITR